MYGFFRSGDQDTLDVNMTEIADLLLTYRKEVKSKTKRLMPEQMRATEEALEVTIDALVQVEKGVKLLNKLWGK